MKRRNHGLVAAAILVALGPLAASAQSYQSAGSGWSNSYAFPSPGERQVRLQFAEAQRRADANGFGPAQTVNHVSYTYNYDHSVGEMMISAAEGAYVHVDNKTGPDSGTSTYTVGAVNTSNNQVTIDGNNNVLDLVNSADSTGCQNGSITTSLTQLMDSFDISAAGASAGGAQAFASSGASSGGTPCTW